jgi:hypothetical protein
MSIGPAYYSHNIAKGIKWRKTRWVDHIAWEETEKSRLVGYRIDLGCGAGTQKLRLRLRLPDF